MLLGSEAASVWTSFRKELKRRRWAYQRLELKNEKGIPDVNIHVPQVGDIWVEMKFVRDWTEVIEVGLRREQFNWLLENQRAGRSVCLLAKIGPNWYLWTDPESWKLAKTPCQSALLISRAFASARSINSLCLHFLKLGQ